MPDFGSRLSSLLPRVMDSSPVTRQTACESLQALLYIDQVLENPDNPKPMQEIRLITDIRNRLESRNQADRMEVMDDLAGLLTAVLSLEEVVDVLKQLLVGAALLC